MPRSAEVPWLLNIREELTGSALQAPSCWGDVGHGRRDSPGVDTHASRNMATSLLGPQQAPLAQRSHVLPGFQGSAVSWQAQPGLLNSCFRSFFFLLGNCASWEDRCL